MIRLTIDLIFGVAIALAVAYGLGYIGTLDASKRRPPALYDFPRLNGG